MKTKVLFLDRDGTLNVEPDDNQVDELAKIRLVRGVMPALLALREAGYRFVMVSNQDGLGTESFPQEQFETCHQHILAMFESQGIGFDEIFICPHFEADRCDCRKPKAALLAYCKRNKIKMLIHNIFTALSKSPCKLISDSHPGKKIERIPALGLMRIDRGKSRRTLVIFNFMMIFYFNIF